MEEGLVQQGEVGGPDDAAAPGDPDGAGLGRVEGQQGAEGHVGRDQGADVDPDAEGLLHLVGRRGLAHADGVDPSPCSSSGMPSRRGRPTGSVTRAWMASA